MAILKRGSKKMRLKKKEKSDLSKNKVQSIVWLT